MLAIAEIHKEALEVDQALRAAQGALASYKAHDPELIRHVEDL